MYVAAFFAVAHVKISQLNCQQDVFATGLWPACQQVVTMLLLYQVATSLSLTICYQVVELLEQAGNKQFEFILLTSCCNSIATSLLQVCYN
jgi:hypothetical protein